MLRIRSVFHAILILALAIAESRVTQAQQDQITSISLPDRLVSSTRDTDGKTTVRAARLTTPLRVDGTLDEALYETVVPISDFIQNDPVVGAPSTEKTEVWVAFDRDNVYVAARCWDSQPDAIIANEMRRDSFNIVQSNDGFGFAFDTFHDRRNSVAFEVSAAGGRLDAQITGERGVNVDWNPVWRAKVGRFAQGWTVEAAIPFKSLRYQAGREQVWGFNSRRVIRRKNESTYMVPLPASMTLRGHFVASLMPTLVGIEAPAGSRSIELKPYAIAQVTTDRTATPRISNKPGGDGGLDAKIDVTDGLTSDFTYNTDFAQVEADEQQVNLTRFSLFFPEKRDFFLDNQGIFAFGGSTAFGPNAGGGGGGGGGGSGVSANPSDTPVLFYSRRIGLTSTGREVPIHGGGRLSGRAGRYSIGVINIESAANEAASARATNFTVARVRRDVLRKSAIGAIATHRSVGEAGRGPSDAYGVDGTFAFYDNLTINTYWARTESPDRPGDSASYRVHLEYTGDRYGVQVERLGIGRHFNPEVGFVRRSDVRRDYAQLRFSPRPRGNKYIRRYFTQASVAYIEDGTGRLQTRSVDGEVALELQNNDRVFTTYNDSYEFLPAPFAIARNVTLPVGGYPFHSVRAGFTRGSQNRFAGSFTIEQGTFYSGRKTAFAFSRGRVFVTPQLSFEPRMSIDRVELREGSFTNQLFGTRATFTIRPEVFVSALVQYNSAAAQASANVRLRWEYRPGSELFVVWNEQRDTLQARAPELMNRSVVVKINRLLRF